MTKTPTGRPPGRPRKTTDLVPAMAATARPADPAAIASAPATRPSGRPLHDEVDTSPVVAHKVYIHVFSSGKAGCLEAVALHEVPLLKRKLEAVGETLTVSEDWPDYVPQERPISQAAMKDEYNRLKAKYTFIDNNNQQIDLMADLYGTPHQGRLLAVIRRQYVAWVKAVKQANGEVLKVADLSDLVQLADPDADFIDAPELAKA